MLKHIYKGKSIRERTFFRQIRSTIIIIITISSYWLVRRNWQFINYILTVLGILQLIIEYQRPNKDLANHQLKLPDHLIIFLFNIFLAGNFLITGASQSPLLGILLIPVILFGAEFGRTVGFWNYLEMIFLFIFSLIFSPTPITFNILIHYITLVIVTGAYLATLSNFHHSNKHYQRKIERLLFHDELTGLYNRRFLKSAVQRKIKNKHQFGLILFDINYFKYYNDYWGHAAGDNLLILIGKVIHKSVRTQDIVVRHSGDEFILVLPEVNRTTIETIINNIIQSIDSYNFPGEECFPNHKLSISYGFSIFPDDARYYQDLFTTADHALYSYKRENFH